MEKDPTPSKLKLEDIYYVLFRHKWMILFFMAAALAGGAVVWKKSARLYSSEARLLVRYIVESGATLPPGSDERVRQVDLSGNSILNTEMEILTSVNLAAEVAELVGPEKILGEPVSPRSLAAATRAVANGVSVELARRSSVIHVAFSNSDPEVTREVLGELIRVYLTTHQEIHESGNTYDLLAKKTDEMRLRLRETEEALQKLREETGSVSLEDAQRSVGNEMENLRESITEVESELAVRQAMSSEEEQTSPPGQSEATMDAPFASTNLTNPGSTASELSFLALQNRLQTLRLREQDYLSRFTEENPMVISVRQQIADLDTQRDAMLEEDPQLGLKSVLVSASPADPAALIQAESDASLRARLMVYTNRLARALAESIRLSDLEKRMSEIQLSREIQQQNWRYAATSLEQARYGSALEFGKNSNINLIQEPTLPTVDNESLMKRAAMVVGGLAGFGLALAFLIELILDPRVKRPGQLDRYTKLPVYVSIPRRLRSRRARKPLPGSAAQSDGSDSGKTATVVSHDGDGSRSYYEALRDRLIVYFERVNLRRKPKLVGVTACHGKAGVTSISEGLAATLSETGGGKVMLVNLSHNQESVQVHPYQMGRPVTELPEVLNQVEGDSQDRAEGSLYLASYGSTSGITHPIRSREFDMLIPKLKASDFDYIVFDMPPMTPTSVTFRVAGFMDKILVVAEAERTHTASLEQSLTLLQESGARVSLVVNKAREYMPRWLRPPQ